MSSTSSNLKFMNLALQEAGKAFIKEEVPVGAVISEVKKLLPEHII